MTKYDFKDKNEYKTKLKQYRKKVQYFTNKQPLNQLLNYKERGRNKFHLDHIIPVLYGFLHNIEPEVIGDIRNLRFIPYKSNLKKKDYLDKTSWDVYFMMIDEGMI